MDLLQGGLHQGLRRERLFADNKGLKLGMEWLDQEPKSSWTIRENQLTIIVNWR